MAGSTRKRRRGREFEVPILLVAILIACSGLVSGARVAHVIVALADNKYQGIVPVPAAIGNGDDPAHNLYWGAGYGVRTYFQRSGDWQVVGKCAAGKGPVLERCVFHNRHQDVFVVADA
jgi:hypothetical protein